MPSLYCSVASEGTNILTSLKYLPSTSTLFLRQEVKPSSSGGHMPTTLQTGSSFSLNVSAPAFVGGAERSPPL
jgi:hypothetical protein